MKIRSTLICFTLSLYVVARLVGADAPKKKSEDAVLNALAGASLDVYERQGEIAKRALPLIGRMEELISKAKNPKQPTGEQLSQKDRDEFDLISAQLKFTEGSRIFNERRLEDISMIESLHRASVFMTTTAIAYINDANGRDFDTYLLASARKAGIEKEVMLLLAVRAIADKEKKESNQPPEPTAASGRGSS